MDSVQRSDVRVVVIGDAHISPSGDPKGMGWVGRVLAKTPVNDPRIDFFALPAPDESSSMLAGRWIAEVGRRFTATTENRLVIALSNIDSAAGVSVSRSRLNLATILDEAARANIKCLVVGPIPPRDPAQVRDVEHLVSGYEDVAARRGIPFVDCFRPLVEHDGWNEEIAATEAGRPGQVGHGLIAWLVLNRGWYDWLEVKPV
mgnify:FL=1